VACNWRIRHKLFLGLGLVVAVMALLLTGTLKGLASYRATMRTFTSRLEELREADKIRNAVKVLGERGVKENQNQATDLRDKIKEAREALESYKEKLTETVEQGRDPDNGFQELEQVKALEQCFLRLDDAIDRAVAPSVRPPQDSPLDLLQDGTPTKMAIDNLIATSNDLNNVIYNDLYKRIKTARTDFKTSLAIVLSTTVAGVLLMLALLRWF